MGYVQIIAPSIVPNTKYYITPGIPRIRCWLLSLSRSEFGTNMPEASRIFLHVTHPSTCWWSVCCLSRGPEGVPIRRALSNQSRGSSCSIVVEHTIHNRKFMGLNIKSKEDFSSSRISWKKCRKNCSHVMDLVLGANIHDEKKTLTMNLWV